MADTISTPPFVKDIAFGVTEPAVEPSSLVSTATQIPNDTLKYNAISGGANGQVNFVEPTMPVSAPQPIDLDSLKYSAFSVGAIGAAPVVAQEQKPIAGSAGILAGITANAAPTITATTTPRVTAAGKTIIADISGGKSNDWRVKLSLAPNADYLYKGLKEGEASILRPLVATSGVVFPYTPTISVSYAASYDPVELTHTNYKIFQYRNSSVGDISISAEFTAQDTNEANYMLAVIHFFKSVTKMFYGKDESPIRGTPPPLCYLSGYGQYQFDKHPLVVTNFTYSLPNDVDYIRAGDPAGLTASGLAAFDRGSLIGGSAPKKGFLSSKLSRLFGSKVQSAAKPPPPAFKSEGKLGLASYVPTKITIQLLCSPVVSRHDVSNKFSLQKYATGELMNGSTRKDGGFGGFW